MKILSWNCRGLGSHWTVSYFREIWHQHKPEFLFLSETKHYFDFVKDFKRILAMIVQLRWIQMGEAVV